MSAKTERRFHYAWAVCAGCALLLFCTSGLCINAFTIYQPYILAWNGFTNAQSSMIVMVRSMTSFASMLACGVYYKHLSLRNGMGLAGAILVLGLFLFGTAHSFFLYCIASGVVGIGYGFGTMIPIAVVLERWFIRKRTLAVGICSAVTGLSTLGIPSLLTWMIESLGLSAAFYIEGTAVAVLILLSFFLIRSRPADVGMEPYGEWEHIEAENPAGGSRGLERRDWRLLVPILLCVGAFTSVGYSHITVLASGEGFSSRSIAMAVTISGLTLTVAKFGYGWLSERMTTYRMNWLFGAVLTAGLLLCCFTGGSRAMLYLAMVAYGMGLPLGTVGITAWAGDLAVPEQYDETIQRFQTGYAAGGLVFSSVPGILADRFGGSYVPAYLLMAALAAFMVFSLQRIYRRHGQAK